MLKYKGNAFLLWRSIIAEEFVKTGLMDGMGESDEIERMDNGQRKSRSDKKRTNSEASNRESV